MMVDASLHRRVVCPSKIAHFVIRTRYYEDSVRWYQTFLSAEIVYQSEAVTFLTFDDEHHRVAIGPLPGLEPHAEKGAGIDHIALSYDSLRDLMDTYERLKDEGIVPFWSINHGPTTSLYYKDPDGAQIEIQTDNVGAAEGAAGVFRSEQFALNPVGVEFDPDELSRRSRTGIDEALLLRPIAS